MRVSTLEPRVRVYKRLNIERDSRRGADTRGEKRKGVVQKYRERSVVLFEPRHEELARVTSMRPRIFCVHLRVAFRLPYRSSFSLFESRAWILALISLAAHWPTIFDGNFLTVEYFSSAISISLFIYNRFEQFFVSRWNFFFTPIFDFPIPISTLSSNFRRRVCFVKFTSVEEIIIEINSLSFEQLYKNS